MHTQIHIYAYVYVYKQAYLTIHKNTHIYKYLHIYTHLSYLQNSIAPKWNIYFSFVLNGRLRPSFYKGFDQTFTDIRAISRSHHFELMAAAMAKVIKNSARMCQDQYCDSQKRQRCQKKQQWQRKQQEQEQQQWRTGKRNRRMKRILAGGKQKLDKM